MYNNKAIKGKIMDLDFEVTKRIQWLKERMSMTELEEQYIRVQLSSSLMQGQESHKKTFVNTIESIADEDKKDISKSFASNSYDRLKNIK